MIEFVYKIGAIEWDDDGKIWEMTDKGRGRDFTHKKEEILKIKKDAGRL